MKESEFIELLNLYLDHEISAADSARLEAEVQGNPARRKVYQQYCRMQKACRLLASDFQTDVSEETDGAERKIIAFNPATAAAIAAGRKRARAFYAVGGLAAAACVALMVVNRGGQTSPATNGSSKSPAEAAIAQTPVAAPVSSEQVRVASDSSRPRLLGVRPTQPRLVADPLLLAGSTQSEAILTAADTETSEHLKWIPGLQIAPLQQRVAAEELKFTERPGTLRPEARVLGGNRPPAEATVEMTAFRFAK